MRLACVLPSGLDVEHKPAFWNIIYQNDPLNFFGIGTGLEHLRSTPQRRKTRYELFHEHDKLLFAKGPK